MSDAAPNALVTTPRAASHPGRVARARWLLPGGPAGWVLKGGLAFTGAVSVLDLTLHAIDRWLHPDFLIWPQLMRLADPGKEASIPTWFAVVGLAACAALLAAIGVLARRAGDRWARHWLFLALVILALSVDEQAMIHDAPSKPLREVLGVGGLLHFAWVIPAVATVLVVGLIYLRFLLALPARTRALFAAAATLYVLGAVGFEMVGGWWVEGHGGDSAGYIILTAIEEAFEMAGMVVALAALIAHLGTVLAREPRGASWHTRHAA